MTDPSLPTCLTPLDELAEARRERSPGVKLDALRRAGRRLRDRLATAGSAIAVRTFDLITFPYPSRYALTGAARSPAPYVMMRNRMQLVQVGWHGSVITILVNPTDPDRSLEAPFFAKQIERYGQFVSRRLLSKRHGSVEGALAEVGVAPEAVDFITFDHLHVQDVRGLLGTEAPEPGAAEPTPALLPNARLLVQPEELRTLACLHPLQVPWYVRDGVRSVPAEKIVVTDGDFLVGDGGFALVKTPGHTDGNHTLVVGTQHGLWTISENGVAADAYAPEHSDIPGVRRHAGDAEVEVILNGNTRENSLDQYCSMVLEKTIADPSSERPEFPQHFPSSEMVPSLLAPGLKPTFSHRHITHGALAKPGHMGWETQARRGGAEQPA